MGTSSPLDGITVLDLSSVGPAARASRILADYGAGVVKVGPPPKKAGVQIDPPAYAYSGHRGMRRLGLDLKSDAGREAFLRLAEHADVVIESFRPGVSDRLGIGYHTVAMRNPGIVYCATSGYGQTGPRRAWAGHDLNYLGVGGYLDCSGRGSGGEPALPGATVADIAAGGMQAAMSIMAALVERQRTSRGDYLDVSIADGVLSMMSLYADEYLVTGEVPGPGHYVLTGRYACYGIYPTRDGAWLTVAAIEAAFWANLCRALDLERWIDHQYDDSVQDRIRADLTAAFAADDRDAWVERLGPADCCVAPVLSVPESVVDAQFEARHAVVEAESVTLGRFRQVGAVLAGQGPLDEPVSVKDMSVSDCAAVLSAAGFGADEIEVLEREGVVA
ncbi:MAG: CoA transferase [Acidimicrobiia bacterium]|nr:CoA transferase [Acidimicrobiia bacterium]